MLALLTYNQWIRRVIYFFPFQLLLLHLKKNHLLLLAWILLFGYITENVGVKYGIPYLFLFPEYFGRVGFLSYAITGFALGGFITAFNLYSYAMHGYRFPFIATISRPFLKFNINNALIPAAFVITFLWFSARFQYHKELLEPITIAWHLTGFLVGIFTFLSLALLYFTRTNTDVIKLLGSEPAPVEGPTEPIVELIGPQHDAPPKGGAEKRQATRWLRQQQRSEKWRVETYLSPGLRIMLARSSAHYDRKLLRDVLWQNHVNGAIFELILVATFLLLGAFSDKPFFSIPAGASAFLLFTVILMVISAIFSWLQGWTGTVIIGSILALNFLSHNTNRFLYDNQAYGLDYKTPPAVYDLPTIAAMANDTMQAQQDKKAMLVTLEKWKERNLLLDNGGEKPKMVLVNASGGGLRSMLWSLRTLQYADSLLGGTLMDRTMLVAGSSGGLIGATYYRQLALDDQSDKGTERFSHEILSEISSDILNPVVFSLVTNDMFIRYRSITDGEQRYTLDRAYAFENRLNTMTRGKLNVRMGEMAAAEREARTPLLVLSPTSINDGRRLVIGSLPMAFLTNISPEDPVNTIGYPESIEFKRMFAGHAADSLKLSSALRMNATFPYITPVVSLPSDPPMRVMDAGMRDNYGYRVTLSFMHTFRDWLAENTSGVVILQLRDTQRDLDVRPIGTSLLGRIMDPVGSIYDNFVRVQDQDYDLMLHQAGGWTDFPLQVIDLELRHTREEQISLSWHLTALERKRVLWSITSPSNQRAFGLLRDAVYDGNGPFEPTVAARTAPVQEGDPSPRSQGSSRGPTGTLRAFP
jgi:hypothetical protein